MKYLVSIALFCFMTGGCYVYDYHYDDRDRHDIFNAEVLYLGAPEVDGCGWLIRINDKLYHPENLADEFKVNNLSVLVEFIRTREVFRCGRGGTPYNSIHIISIRKNPSGKEVGILADNEWGKLKMDAFRMDSAMVKGDTLRLKVSYGGGCRKHLFRLWKLPKEAQTPSKMELLLDHDSNGDVCEAWLTQWLSFSLIPLREQGKHEITFLLRGSPEMSAYFGEYTYKY